MGWIANLLKFFNPPNLPQTYIIKAGWHPYPILGRLLVGQAG